MKRGGVVTGTSSFVIVVLVCFVVMMGPAEFCNFLPSVDATPVPTPATTTTTTPSPTTTPRNSNSIRRGNRRPEQSWCFSSPCGAEFYECPENCSYGYRPCTKARIETVCCCGF
ncbi:uncharacterized protein LOC110848889 [Folsomia candida]|uniref:Uncharacterized protein n=1 Tax=Folsomia candida TaxID=158441 RepID=A0A226EDI1_FOLCA|nr:uncharacterized protein LOC110848889 [Folsomia candida]OXA55572.1 hypothetical protein Fcan01_09002 [Folsomia candida]